jgi:hypothetical protein
MNLLRDEKWKKSLERPIKVEMFSWKRIWLQWMVVLICRKHPALIDPAVVFIASSEFELNIVTVRLL